MNGSGESCALIIDDEADQASVETARINPLIMRILRALPRHTYLGYTATPFANVLINPEAADLYPSDFILSLPQPEGYMGSEVIFGRETNADEPDDDGYPMIRLIDEADAAAFRYKSTRPYSPQSTAFAITDVKFVVLPL